MSEALAKKKKISSFWFVSASEPGVDLGNTNIPSKFGTDYARPLTSKCYVGYTL
jgi:hypothetical protein